nr:PREDICTED: serine protease 56 [Lepisosteus oculatus]XP_015216523.1 PREDICTED: serine protease 56 [Lepisosteus oculatus]
MLLVYLLQILDCSFAAPTGREVYRLPQSTLQALSERGTVVLEAALASALSALELAVSERSRAERGCKGCPPCLFQDCGQRTGPCDPLQAGSSEPSCEVIDQAQRLSDERDRNWALSQACGYYQRRCQAGEVGKESCIRIMGESCSARVLQCRLLNTMQNLDTVSETKGLGVCGRKMVAVQNVTQPRSRIVGGFPAAPGAWPWLVNLRLEGELMCGGVLVDSTWVLTAAHCFTGSRSENSWTAVVGEFDITKTDAEEQVMKVNRIISHPKFNKKTFNNDIALVELTSPVVLSDRVTPVCLPSGEEPAVGTPCSVAGWGSLYEDGPSADVVMEAKVPILSQNTCKSALGKELVTNTMFCAGYLSGGIDSCQGDSGGPLTCQDPVSGRFQLYGITSWGDGCGVRGKPGVYTRVTAFSDWVRSEIQKSLGSREPTCPELLRTSELSEEQQRSEFSALCRFYVNSCSPLMGTAACTHLAEDKCRTRYKKCQLRSFLQTLLDLLQRADVYIREKVDLSFFTKTLPQLVEHIYSTAFTTRERREAPSQTEQVALSVQPGDVAGRTIPLFKEVGPLVEDWAEYLRGIAEDLDNLTNHKDHKSPHQEKTLFLQAEAPAVHKLEREYRSLIELLHSKLGSGVASSAMDKYIEPLQEKKPLQGVDGEPGLKRTSTLTASPELQEPTLISAISAAGELKARTTKGSYGELTTSMPQGSDLAHATAAFEQHEPSTVKASTVEYKPAFSESSTQAHALIRGGSNTLPSSPTGTVFAASQPAIESSFTKQMEVYPRHRNLRKRQVSGTSNKALCPGESESAQHVNMVREAYRWILGIPSKNLCMTFQEVLVDIASKNEKGLYEARVRATVGGRPFTFYSLVGLESESFYRSMPRVIALALDALKT